MSMSGKKGARRPRRKFTRVQGGCGSPGSTRREVHPRGHPGSRPNQAAFAFGKGRAHWPRGELQARLAARWHAPAGRGAGEVPRGAPRTRSATANRDRADADGASSALLAAPSLLAHIVVDKFCDGLPLFRIEQPLRRDGCRSTAARCPGGWRRLAQPCGATVVAAMREAALRTAFCIATDATGVAVQPERAEDKPGARRAAAATTSC